MNNAKYLLRELQALQRRTGESAERERREAELTQARLAEEAGRNDETDAALVEVGGLSADTAATQEEIMAAQVELAGMVDAVLTRADEQDAALVEIAGLVDAVTTTEGSVE